MTKTRSAKSPWPVTAAGDEWYAWKARLWDSMAAKMGFYPGLAPLEQYTHRSHREQRCIECGESGTAQQTSQLIQSVPHYWFCGECAAYWAAKAMPVKRTRKARA